ncbi:MAG: CRTAC1 family protein [Microthrixaceae bacterium]|nr:CRTAC1 family protein [Microthrixaceae bacterium]
MNNGYRRNPVPAWLAGALLVGVLIITGACSADDEASPGAGQDQPSGTGDAGTQEPSVETVTDDRPPAQPGDLRFTEVAAEAGLDEAHSDLGLEADSSMTSGAAVADVDGDGDEDIFLPRVGKSNALYLNDGSGNFADVAQQAGVAGPSERFGSSAAVFFDIEGDGDPDLFVTGFGQGGNELFVNDGTGSFSEESGERGLVWDPVPQAGIGSHTHGVSVADVDGDGHMDLLVLQWYAHLFDTTDPAPEQTPGDDSASASACEASAALRAEGFPSAPGTPASRSRLFLNDGNGAFADATDEMELPLDEIVAFTGSFADFDGDGWQDLAITGDGCTSRLFRNIDGQRFEDATEAAGVGTDENGMGSVVRDVNGDGLPDWFITSISKLTPGECPGNPFAGCSGNRLYLNEGAGRFSDGTDRYGVRDSGWGWGTAIEDFNNDGNLEIVVTNGYDGGEGSVGQQAEYEQEFLEDPTRLWALDDDGVYRDLAQAAGISDVSIGHALVPFDMDADGDLDILIVPLNDRPLLYRNDTPEDFSWLTIGLDDPANPGNRWGDGARIEVTPDADSAAVVGWITTGGSYESQKPPLLHLGLGERSEPVARIEVHWPGDPTPQVLTDVALDQRLVITRSQTG